MSASSEIPLLSVESVDFSYGHLQVLFGISLHADPGEALALLGTNGAGKSTLLRVICGLERPAEGTVRLGGEDISGVAAERLVARGVAMVSGGKATFADMSVEENLQIKAGASTRSRAHKRERMSYVYSTFPNLAKRRTSPAGRLSGGEQQQLAIAKALLLEPRLLCIDELSLGLAPVIVAELLEIIRQLSADGMTIIVVEQSLNVAAALCDRAVFLEKGEVRFEGATADLRDNDDIARAVFFGAS